MKHSPTSRDKPTFTQGSTMRHVTVMAATGAVGLIAIFVVDLANLFYISLLGQQELAAAVGYASTIMFFSVSVCIGLSIAATAITARALGAKDVEAAHKNAASSLVIMGVCSGLVALLMYPTLGPLLSLIGAKGETHAIALGFMKIVVPSIPLMGLGICLSSLLRARGDARRAMYVTLSAGLSAAVIDPFMIFGLDLKVTGAAIAIVIVRIIMVGVGIHGVWYVHRMLAMPDRAWLIKTVRPFMVIGLPAMLTQIATPVGNAYVTGAVAQFGDDAVAGWAIVGRVIPLTFAAIFSLSGAVGPILSQNYGAGMFDRVNSTMRDSLVFLMVYVGAMWLLLALTYPYLIMAFGARGDAAEMIRFFCLFVAGSFVFNAALFVANAAFNNLGNPMLSTAFNWGRATLGVIPFVHFGMAWGPQGILAGWGLGGVVFGALAVVIAFRKLRYLPERAARDGILPLPTVPAGNSPFTSGRGATLGQ
ncbi:MAG: MATE family efflux transporter [Nitratireductor sp.]